MKPYRISYYILAQKEILEQKVVSFLILTAVVLSTMMTTAVVQSAGVLTAMRRQQAVMLRNCREIICIFLESMLIYVMNEFSDSGGHFHGT